jgi:hypothetical protein
VYLHFYLNSIDARYSQYARWALFVRNGQASNVVVVEY